MTVVNIEVGSSRAVSSVCITLSECIQVYEFIRL